MFGGEGDAGECHSVYGVRGRKQQGWRESVCGDEQDENRYVCACVARVDIGVSSMETYNLK